MLWDEPKIFFLERRYFFSIILSEFLKNRVALHKLNVDDAQVLAQKYEVETIPTLILFRGGQASEQLINPASKAAILEWLKGQGAIEG